MAERPDCAGRFLKEYSADELLFGNVFDRPLKLPWGFSAALKFMKCVPSLAPSMPPMDASHVYAMRLASLTRH